MNVPRKLVSILICTRDRADSLRHTLAAIDACLVPGDLTAEVIVVDNGSQDRTRSVVRRATCLGRPPRYVFEPRRGQSNARNTAIASAQGEVLLWTDDDVRPGELWIEAMGRPLLEDRADAIAGRVVLPGYLERPWLRPWHRVCLAVDAPTTGEFNLTGANMAFARQVLKKVPVFDAELGAGAMGFCDDTLFSRQVRAAGFRMIAAGNDSLVEHHCGESRLTRAALADVFSRQGRSQAYVDYHWLHRTRAFAALRGGKSSLALRGLQAVRWLAMSHGAPIGRNEARSLWRSAYYAQLAIEMRRPRLYEPRGLEKSVVSLKMEDVYGTPLALRTWRKAA